MVNSIAVGSQSPLPPNRTMATTICRMQMPAPKNTGTFQYCQENFGLLNMRLAKASCKTDRKVKTDQVRLFIPHGIGDPSPFGRGQVRVPWLPLESEIPLPLESEIPLPLESEIPLPLGEVR